MPARLGAATDRFQASLERTAREIVAAAEARAAEIESEADHAARHRERRSVQLLDSLELIQTALSGMLEELRSELQIASPSREQETPLLHPVPPSTVDPRPNPIEPPSSRE